MRIEKCDITNNQRVSCIVGCCIKCTTFTDLRNKDKLAHYWTDLRKKTGSSPVVWEWGDGSQLTYYPWRSVNPPDEDYQKVGVMYKWTLKGLIGSKPTWKYNFICEKI